MGPKPCIWIVQREAQISQVSDPDGPKCEEVFRIDDEDDIVNVGEDLNHIFGVSVREDERCLVEKVIDSGS